MCQKQINHRFLKLISSKELVYYLLQVIFILIFSVKNLSAIAQIDSLKKVLSNAKNPSAEAFALSMLSSALEASNPDTALLLAQQAVRISKNNNNDSNLAAAYHSMGWCYFRLGKKDSAEYFFKAAQVLYHSLKQNSEEGVCLVNLSTVYNEYQEYSKSLNCIKSARPLLENAKNEKMLAYADRTVGVIYRQEGLYDQSIKYFLSAIFTFKKLNNLPYLADTYTSYGTVFWFQNKFDSALYYYRSSYNIQKYNIKNLSGEAYSAEDIAKAFYKKANEQNNHPWIDSAYNYYVLALNAFIKLGGKENIQFEKTQVGDVLRIMKQYKNAEVYLLNSYNFFDSTKEINDAYDAANALSKLYKDIGDYKKAYDYILISDQFKDTIDAQNRADSIATMFAQYETEKKDRTIKLLNTQQQLDKQQISIQHIIEIFSFLGVFLLIILFFVLINRNRIKQQLKEVKVRNQLAGDLHDEVGSSLSSILLLSNMASKKITQESEAKNMLKKITDNTKEVIDKTGDIVWMMNPKYDEGENLKEKLEQYVLRMKEVAQFQVQLNISPAINTIKFPMEVRKNIFLIIKEAGNNALKYSEATEMNIALQTNEKNILINISDNGKGFNKTAVTAGNGLETMALRAKDVNGNLEIQSSQGNGTQIKVTMPIPHSR